MTTYARDLSLARLRGYFNAPDDSQALKLNPGQRHPTPPVRPAIHQPIRVTCLPQVLFCIIADNRHNIALHSAQPEEASPPHVQRRRITFITMHHFQLPDFNLTRPNVPTKPHQCMSCVKQRISFSVSGMICACLLYTSDAADE